MIWNVFYDTYLDLISVHFHDFITWKLTNLIPFSSNMYWCNTLYFCYLADDEPPILNCQNLTSTTDEGLNSSSTVLLTSTATDNVNHHLDVICSHSSEDIFLIGDTTVNCSSTDAAGNTETCIFVATVTGDITMTVLNLHEPWILLIFNQRMNKNLKQQYYRTRLNNNLNWQSYKTKLNITAL